MFDSVLNNDVHAYNTTFRDKFKTNGLTFNKGSI